MNGRYRLDTEIGKGGFARVYLATDTVLERRVAVKVLNAELTGDPTFVERFGREARAIAALEHPNILAVYDYGQAEGTAYLVTPYIEGGTLFDKLANNSRLDLQTVSRYLSQITSALDYAHSRNIVHRDIKPQNMLVRADTDQLLLADFGIAKVMTSGVSQTHTAAIGTPSYMSPEQLNGNVSKATDIYALGCVLFQMLTGELPYSGTTEQVLLGHLHGAIPSIVARSGGQIPANLQTIIDRALAKYPEARYPTAGDLYKAYQIALQSVVVDAPPEILTQALPPNRQPTPLQPQPQPYVLVPPQQQSTPLQPALRRLPSPVASLPRPLPVPASKKPNLTLIAGFGAIAAIILVSLLLLLLAPPTPKLAALPSVTASSTANPVLATATVPVQPTTAELVTVTPALPTVTPVVLPTNTNMPSVPTITPPATVPPAFTLDEARIRKALQTLPGTTSVVILPQNGTPIEDDPTRQMPSASTIKLWVAATVFDEVAAKRLDPNQKYIVKDSDIASGTGILRSNVGKTYTILQLVSTMLIYSDNSATNILIDKLSGFDRVNSYIQRNGYTQTRLQRRLGDTGNSNNNLTSGRDATNFMQNLLAGKIVDSTSSDLILKALQARLSYPQDQNFFGTQLPQGLEYRHISGTGTKIRNEVGYFVSTSGQKVIVAIYNSEMTSETEAEAAISKAISEIYQSVP